MVDEIVLAKVKEVCVEICWLRDEVDGKKLRVTLRRDL
jgi:hypothetical protein